MPETRRLDEHRDDVMARHAQLVDALDKAFDASPVGEGRWSVELVAATEGASVARLQQLHLRPGRPRFPVVIAGTIDLGEMRAELRDFDHVSILHQVRSRQPFLLTTAEWEAFLRKAELVLNESGIQSMRTPPTRELLEKRRSMERISKNAVIALVVVLVLASLVLWRVALAILGGKA